MIWLPGAEQLPARASRSREEKFLAGMPGCPMEPKGRKYSSLAWNQELGSRELVVCTYSLGLLVSPHPCIQSPAFCFSGHTRKKEAVNLNAWSLMLLSLNVQSQSTASLCPTYKFPEE